MRTRVVDFFMVGRHFRALFLLAVLFPLPLQAEQSRIFMSHSEAVTALIQQADQTYARAANTSIQHFFNNIPVNAAICMGLAMHGQKQLAEQTPGYQDHYEALRREVHEFLGNLAKAHNFKNPFDGQPMDRQFLAGIFDSNASGAYNQWAVENRMPDPGVVRQPLILDRVTPQSLAKLHLKDDADEIRLLDEGATRPQTDPPPEADKVIGTWTTIPTDTQATITVSKQDGRYVAIGADEFGIPIGFTFRYQDFSDQGWRGKPGNFIVDYLTEHVLQRDGSWKALAVKIYFEYVAEPGSNPNMVCVQYGQKGQLSCPNISLVVGGPITYCK